MTTTALETLTTDEVAALLDLSPVTVQRWLRRGLLSGVRLPGRAGWRVDPRSVERLLAGSARPSLGAPSEGTA